jgi:hypothetical protein
MRRSPTKSEGGLVDPPCSRNPHDEKGRNDTHAGLVLPERAPSEGPRSTGAMRPAWAPFPIGGHSKLGRINCIYRWWSFDARSGRSNRPPSWREIGELGEEKGVGRQSFLLAEAPRYNGGPSMRAGKDHLPTSFECRKRENRRPSQKNQTPLQTVWNRRRVMSPSLWSGVYVKISSRA